MDFGKGRELAPLLLSARCCKNGVGINYSGKTPSLSNDLHTISVIVHIAYSRTRLTATKGNLRQRTMVLLIWAIAGWHSSVRFTFHQGKTDYEGTTHISEKPGKLGEFSRCSGSAYVQIIIITTACSPQ